MPRVVTPTVKDAARAYLAACGLKPTPLNDRRRLLERFARSVKNCHMGSLAPEHVSAFMSDLDVQRSTFMKYRSDLARFFEFCVLRGWLRTDLLAEVPRYKNQGRRVRWQLDSEQVITLLEANEDAPRNRAMLVFVLNTALRINEVVALKIGDVDLMHGRILVRISKTDEEDSVRITPSLDAELRSYLTWYSEQVGRAPKREDFLFPAMSRPVFGGNSLHRAQHLRPRNKITGNVTIINGAFHKAGFETERGEGWHTLRRTAARRFFDKANEDTGRDNAMRMTMAFLHHKSMATTEKYLGLTKELTDRDNFLDTDPFDYSPSKGKGNVVPIRRVSNG